MKNIWFISDTHFAHENILKFKDADGNMLRSFNSIEEMDMMLIHNWNEVVQPHDTVYHLGDVLFNKHKEWYLSVLNGTKKLVRGNHDTFKTSLYCKYFTEIYGVKPMYLDHTKIVLSHCPLRLETLDRWGINLHGHLHKKIIEDPCYLNVCVEHTGYRPIHFDEIKEIINARNL